ncbi:MAG: DNA topoisomerase VI subunit B [Deltaproteobacteria bacterium]|nr:DNA topoisomerase VI subunit B [Deltaproteobacteria bacterium]
MISKTISSKKDSGSKSRSKGNGGRQLSLLEQVAPARPAPARRAEPAPAPTRRDDTARQSGAVRHRLHEEPRTPEAEAPAAAAPLLATAAPPPRSKRRATAESMAAQQREISVAEFFTKNRHLLGFDNPAKALLTTVKEAVDNALDAAEEAGILPSVLVEIHEINEERYLVVVQDNGPGIVYKQVPKVFGKLLYGSKFHRLRQSRGQQGIGISAAGMYGQLTTGKPVAILSRTAAGRTAHYFEITIDTRKNQAIPVKDEIREDWPGVDHGTRVEIELSGTYKGGRRSVDEYLEEVAIANPHVRLVYQPPRGKEQRVFERVTDELPREPQQIKPHPRGVELGMLMKILKESKARTLSAALKEDFSRVTSKVAGEICAAAMVAPNTRIRDLSGAEIERLYSAIPKVKILAPPTACVVPIGEELVRRGLEKEIRADFYTSCTRPPTVYRGNPFAIEAGLAYGGELLGKAEDDDETFGPRESGQFGPIQLLRFANRVPLQYQQSACAIFKAVAETNFRQYGLSQPRGGLPQGPMVLFVHIASVWVPFTSESKEAVAHYPEIIKEIKLALRECGRKLSVFLHHRERARNQEKRRSIFELYIGELVESVHKLTPVDRRKLQQQLLGLASKFTGQQEEEEALEVGGVKPDRKAKGKTDRNGDANGNGGDGEEG